MALAASAQEWPQRLPFLRASAEASVTVKPDEATLQIGVMSKAPTAQAAAAQNARQLDAVMAELRKAMGPKGDIKTISYAITPDHRYPKPGQPPEIAGYTANNVVQVKTQDLEAVGKLIDSATASGANRIQALQFGLRDEAGARGQALREAAVKARTQVEAMASALGLRILRIWAVESGGLGPIQPLHDMAMMARAEAVQVAPPTPVQPGTIEVRATVTLTAQIAH